MTQSRLSDGQPATQLTASGTSSRSVDDDELGPTPSGAIEEFRALRTEIDRRCATQQAIVGFQLTSAGAIAGVAISHPGYIGLLLIIPPISLLLLLQWLDNHLQTARIALYVRTKVEPQAGLSWERWLVAHPPGRAHQLTWILSYYILFPGIPAIAVLALPFVTARRAGAGVAFWSVDVALTLLNLGLLKIETAREVKAQVVSARRGTDVPEART